MAVGACGKLSKTMLLILNTVLLSVGIAMLTLGLWLRSKDDTKGNFVTIMIESSMFDNGVTVLITLGSVLLAVVLLGGFSVYNESRRALQVFAVLLALLAACVLVLGSLVFIRSGDVLDSYTTMYRYFESKKDPAIAPALTRFHHAFHCCGMWGWGLHEADEVLKQTCPEPSAVLEIVPGCPPVISSASSSYTVVVMVMVPLTGVLLLTALRFTTILIGKIDIERMQDRVQGGRP